MRVNSEIIRSETVTVESPIKKPKSAKVPGRFELSKNLDSTKQQLSLAKDQLLEAERLIQLQGFELLLSQLKLLKEKDKEAGIAILAKEVERQWTIKEKPQWKSVTATKLLNCLAKARNSSLHKEFVATKRLVEAAPSEFAEVLNWLRDPAYDYGDISQIEFYILRKYEAAAETLRTIKDEVHLWNTGMESSLVAMKQSLGPTHKLREMGALKEDLRMAKQLERKLAKEISSLTSNAEKLKAEVEQADEARKAAILAAEESVELRIEGTPTLPVYVTRDKGRHSTKRPGILIAVQKNRFWYHPAFDEIPHPFPKEWAEEEGLEEGVVELYNENVKLMYVTGSFKFPVHSEDELEEDFNEWLRYAVLRVARFWYKQFMEWLEDHPKATFSYIIQKEIKQCEAASVNDIVEPEEEEEEEEEEEDEVVYEGIVSRVTCDAHAKVTCRLSFFEKGVPVPIDLTEEPFYDEEMARVTIKLKKLRDRMKETSNKKMRMKLHKKVRRAEEEFTKLFKSRESKNSTSDGYVIYFHPCPDRDDAGYKDMLHHLLGE